MATAKIVFSILEAKDGVLWFSTFKGIHMLDGKNPVYADGSLVEVVPFTR